MTHPVHLPYDARPSAPRKGIPGWGWTLSVLFAIILFAIILFRFFTEASKLAHQASCAANMRNLSIQILGYTQDYDGKFPPAGHWMDALETSGKSSELVYRCPAIPQGPDSHGYAYNSNVADKTKSEIAKSETTLMIYDSSTLTRNAFDPGTSLSSKGRHRHGNNIMYADGHVKWVPVASHGK